MAIVDPFTITWGSRQIGGNTTEYRLDGPHSVELAHDTFRLVFDVVVIATDHGNLQKLSKELEDDFRKRDQDLTIDLDGSKFEYKHGTTLLNGTATLTKTGDDESNPHRPHTGCICRQLAAVPDGAGRGAD